MFQGKLMNIGIFSYQQLPVQNLNDFEESYITKNHQKLS